MRLIFVATMMMITVVLVLSGCVTTEKNIAGRTVKVTQETYLFGSPSFPDGEYYQYINPAMTSTLEILEKARSDPNYQPPEVPDVDGITSIDVLPVLQELVQKGVPMEEAWYKPGANACCSVPVIGMCSMSIVEATLVIRVSEEHPALADNFKKMDTPTLGWCPQEAFHYVSG